MDTTAPETLVSQSRPQEVKLRIVTPDIDHATPVVATPLPKDLQPDSAPAPAQYGPDDRFTSVEQVLEQMKTDPQLAEDVERWRESYRRGGPMRNAIFKFDDIFREIISEGRFKASPKK